MLSSFNAHILALSIVQGEAGILFTHQVYLKGLEGCNGFGRVVGLEKDGEDTTETLLRQGRQVSILDRQLSHQ